MKYSPKVFIPGLFYYSVCLLQCMPVLSNELVPLFANPEIGPRLGPLIKPLNFSTEIDNKKLVNLRSSWNHGQFQEKKSI